MTNDGINQIGYGAWSFERELDDLLNQADGLSSSVPGLPLWSVSQEPWTELLSEPYYHK